MHSEVIESRSDREILDGLLEGLDILGRSIDAWLTHASHRLLGVLGMAQGDFASAHGHLEVALQVTREMGFRVDEAQTMARVGRLYRLQGDVPKPRNWPSSPPRSSTGSNASTWLIGWFHMACEEQTAKNLRQQCPLHHTDGFWK
jgi:hypothetical protein